MTRTRRVLWQVSGCTRYATSEASVVPLIRTRPLLLSVVCSLYRVPGTRHSGLMRIREQGCDKITKIYGTNMDSRNMNIYVKECTRY